MSNQDFNDPSGGGLPMELPDTPGNFTEATPPAKKSPFAPPSPIEAGNERARLNFDAARGTAGAVDAALTKQQTKADFANPGPQDQDFISKFLRDPFGPDAPPPTADQVQEDAKKRLEQIEADSLAYKAMPGFSGPGEAITSLLGQAAGGMTTPENIAFPAIKFGGAVWRATHPLMADMLAYGLGQAAVQGVADPLKQAMEVRAGLKKEWDIAQTSLAIPTGFAFGAGIIALNRGVSILYKSGLDAFKGRLTDSLPPLTPEIRPPVVPEPQRSPNMRSEAPGEGRTALPAESLPANALRPEPPVPEGMTRLYRADAPGHTTGKPESQVGFVTEQGRALDTPSWGARAAERRDISFIDVLESVALARRSGDHVYLPGEMASERAVLPEPPAPEGGKPVTDGAIADRAVDGSAPPAASVRTIGPEGGEVAPRLKGMGAPTQAAPPNTARPGMGVASTHLTGELPPLENLSNAMRRIADGLNVSVRKGTNRADSTGTYNFSTQIIRLQNANPNSFVDFSHELGHHVENVVGRSLSGLINSNEQVMRTFGGPMVQAMRTAEGVSEGFGEFMASYITNRERAELVAPNFVRQFRDVMERNNPELLAVIDDANLAWQRYQAAPSRVAGEAMIVSHTEIPEKPDPKDPLKRSAVSLWVSNIYTEYANRQHPMSVAVRFLAEEYEKKYGNLLDLPPDKDPAKILQMFGRGGHQMTVMDMTYGVQNAHTLVPEGPAFFSILRRVAADPITGAETRDGIAAAARLKSFDSYLVARWHKALREQMARGSSDLERPPTRLTDGDAANIIAETERLHPSYAALAEEVYAYNKLLVKKEFDANLRTKDSFDELMRPENHEYVPLRRDMRDITETVKGSGSLGDKKGLETLGRHARVGSDRDVLSPTESIMLRNFSINDQMTENWMKLALRDLTRLVGGKEGAAIAEEIPNTLMRKMDIDVEETLFRTAKENGWMTHDARDMAREVLAEIGPTTRIQLYRSEAIKAGNRPIIFGWDQGERFALQLPDGGFGRQLQEVVDSLGPKGVESWAQASGLVFDMLVATAGTLRAGATGTPTFMAKNIVRDAFMQYLLMPEADTIGTLTLANAVRGGKSFFKGDDFYRMYASTEGIRGGIATNTIADTRRVGDMLTAAGVPGHKQITFKSVKDALSVMEVSESAGRIGLFRAVYESNIAMGRDHRYAMFDAAQKARDFIDYSRFGSNMEMLSRMVPFLNANIQGVDKFVRTYAGTPTNPGMFFKPFTEQQAAYQQQLREALIPRVAALAAISAGITYAYKDDPVYQRIPVQLRSQYWIFRLPFIKSGTYNLAGGGTVELPEGMQGAWITIAKPWEPATIFNLAERAVEFTNSGDPQQIANFVKSMRYTFSLPNPFEFPLLRVSQGLASNYDSFFQRPIVPDSLRQVAPHMQANEYTNKFYVAVAQGLNRVWNSKDARDWFRENMPFVGGAIGAAWSPMEAQYLMQGVFGDWPRELGGLGGIGRSLMNGEAIKTQDIPALRAFVKDSMAAGEPLRELYNQVGQNGGRLTIAAKTFKDQIDKGDTISAQQYFNALDPSQRDYVRLKSSIAGPLVNALHPLDRTAALNTAVRNLKAGLLNEGGLASFNDQTQRIKLEPGLRDVVVQALNEFSATEARNALIVQGAKGFQGVPVVSTAPYLDMIAKASPEVGRELSARLAAGKVLPIETIQRYWPEVQKGLRVGGEPKDLSRELRGIGLEAAAQGYLGGGTKTGRGASDSSGQRIKRGKTQFPALSGEAGTLQ